MEQNQLSEDLNSRVYLKQIKSSRELSPEIVALVEEDIDYGLPLEKVRLYAEQRFRIGQMRVISKCLRENLPDKLIEKIAQEKYSKNQMQVALDYYLKGVPVEDIIAEIDKNQKPCSMKETFEAVLEKLNAAKSVDKSGLSAAQQKRIDEVLGEVGKFMDAIKSRDEKYDELSRRVSEIAAQSTPVNTEATETDTAKQAQSVSSDTDMPDHDEYREKVIANQNMIVMLQDRLNDDTKQIKNVMKKIEEMESGHSQAERNRNKWIDDILERLDRLESNPKDALIRTDDDRKVNDMKEKSVTNGSAQLEYTIPITDARGRIADHIAVEHSARKTSGVGALFATIGFKKRSRIDIVKRTIAGQLAPDQLAQIRSAIERGLSEAQLVELINSNVAADRMKGIIEVAVLANSLGY